MKNIVKELENEIPEKINKKTPAQISEEILAHYFTVEGNKVKVRLNFDTFSELVDQSLGDDSVEKLNPTLFEKLSETFALIPRKYEIEVDVYISDFGDYTLEEAEKIVKNNVTLMIYALALERRRKRITGLSLLGGGVVLLLASDFLGRLDLPQIFFDVINISGTLLVWEAADVTLIERGADVKRAKQYVKKFKEIRLMQAENEKARE